MVAQSRSTRSPASSPKSRWFCRAQLRCSLTARNRPHVRFWPKAIPRVAFDVAFGGKADMTVCRCPLSRSLLGVEPTAAEQNGITQGFLVFFGFEKRACVNTCVNKMAILLRPGFASQRLRG